MRAISLAEIVEAVGGTLLCGSGETVIRSVVTDSRALEEGCLFVPLCGPNFDGHDFIGQALEGGAAASLTSRDVPLPEHGALIRVQDTLLALQKTAGLLRDRIPGPVVGLTGSVGKTTTRDMTAAVLSRKYATLKTEDNLNNEIGLPKTLLGLEEWHEAAVLEMGMDRFGEIARMSAAARPDISIITNIGVSHIERLGSQENIYRAKAELLPNTKPNGTVLFNGDDAILRRHRQEVPQTVYLVGRSDDCDARASQIESDADSVRFRFDGFGRSFPVTLNVPGEHNVSNALFAVATGLLCGVEPEEIAAALAEFRPTGMRLEFIRVGDFTVINDCYNAAPDSVAAALKVLGGRGGKRIAVLGDIACLGDYTERAHLQVGKDAAKNGADELFAVGDAARYIAQGAKEAGMPEERIHFYGDVQALLKDLPGALEAGCHVLVKASRVMKLERVTQALTALGSARKG